MENNVSAHLTPFVARQDYARYTPVNQAVWRYVMRRNVDFLRTAAHPVYLPGLHKTGISIDAIPDVRVMNQRMEDLGWGVVVVDGLIPSVAFFDFQARGLLPVSVDIRTLQHVEYTPAPDIIHEAAGHAPILADPQFADYVRLFGRIGAKALGTKAGHDVFDALRVLTILLESPNADPEEIREAERVLAERRLVRRAESEESFVSRLYWWTVEYGLIGSLSDPKIYGAGLLSSVSEGRNCLNPQVEKLPFDLETCISTRYDVTKPQPQLFVCQDFEQLTKAVLQLSERMAFRVGGTASLQKAVESGRDATVQFSSGLQVTGTWTEVRLDDTGYAAYLRSQGQTALAVNGRELEGQGRNRHKAGFGSPIGKLAGEDKPLELFSDADLLRSGIQLDGHADLMFESGVRVSGTVLQIIRRAGRTVVISLSDCTVTFRGETLFAPSWGIYDMAVGERIDSVYAGAADPDAFYAAEEQVPAVTVTATTDNPPLQRLYQLVRDVREGREDEVRLQDVTVVLDRDFPDDWLLRLELLELLHAHRLDNKMAHRLEEQLARLQQRPELAACIQSGLALLHRDVSEVAPVR